MQRREKIVIWLLVNNPQTTYQNIKDRIKPEDIQVEKNSELIKKLYEEFEKGNSNINQIMDSLGEEEVNYITSIMTENIEISDVTKGIKDILTIFLKEKLIKRRNEIINKLENASIVQKEELEKELNDIIIKLSKLK